MPSPLIYDLFQGTPVTVHAFNASKTRLAVSPNNNHIHILSLKGSTWSTDAILTEHDKLVTGLDWAPLSNTLVSCSQDRNAYVWNESGGGVWSPTLVNLRINRAATCVKWSPNETKFAVGSGARVICVCYFESDNNWWVAKHLKKPLRSTILSLSWHPDNILLASGSADSHARVHSAFIKGLDAKIPSPIWGEKLEFGTLCADWVNETGGGWVHGISFSPDGANVGWVGHDCCMSVANPSSPIQCVKTGGLPFMDLEWVSDERIVAAGYDCTPVLFVNRGGWRLVGKVDEGIKKDSVIGGGGNAAMNKFRAMDTRAQEVADGGSELGTVHQNTITCLRGMSGGRVSSSGIDGKLVVWELGGGIAGLKI